MQEFAKNMARVTDAEIYVTCLHLPNGRSLTPDEGATLIEKTIMPVQKRQISSSASLADGGIGSRQVSGIAGSGDHGDHPPLDLKLVPGISQMRLMRPQMVESGNIISARSASSSGGVSSATSTFGGGPGPTASASTVASASNVPGFLRSVAGERQVFVLVGGLGGVGLRLLKWIAKTVSSDAGKAGAGGAPGIGGRSSDVTIIVSTRQGAPSPTAHVVLEELGWIDPTNPSTATAGVQNRVSSTGGSGVAGSTGGEQDKHRIKMLVMWSG